MPHILRAFEHSAKSVVNVGVSVLGLVSCIKLCKVVSGVPCLANQGPLFLNIK